MSAPVPDQAILGPLIYAPPWARAQAPARDLMEDWVEPVATEPASLDDAQEPDPITQPSANFEDDFAVMTLEECLALAPDQVGEAAEEITDFEPFRWPGTAGRWPHGSPARFCWRWPVPWDFGGFRARRANRAKGEPNSRFMNRLLMSRRCPQPSHRSRLTANRNRRRHFGRLI